MCWRWKWWEGVQHCMVANQWPCRPDLCLWRSQAVEVKYHKDEGQGKHGWSRYAMKKYEKTRAGSSFKHGAEEGVDGEADWLSEVFMDIHTSFCSFITRLYAVMNLTVARHLAKSVFSVVKSSLVLNCCFSLSKVVVCPYTVSQQTTCECQVLCGTSTLHWYSFCWTLLSPLDCAQNCGSTQPWVLSPPL